MITLHIQDEYIRVMVTDGRQVLQVARCSLEKGLVENGLIVEKSTVSQLIKDLLAANTISDKQVITGISGVHSMYHTVTLPHLAKNMVDEAARHELARAMPMPLNELYTSWQAVDISDMETMLCMVGLPKNTVDSVLETLQEAGLQPVGVDIIPLAIARLTDSAEAIVVNVQPFGANILIMANGIPEILHSITFPSGEIELKDKIKLVKEELARTVTFFNQSHKQNPITSATSTFVSGEMRDALVASLNYQIKPLPNWLSSKVSYDINEYTVNAGLALKGIKESRIPVRINIDARPALFLPKSRPLITILSWAVLGLAIITLIPMALLAQSAAAETATLAAKVNSSETQIKSRQPVNAFLKLIESQADTIKAAQGAYKDSLNAFIKQQASVNGSLSKITSLLPGTMNITSVSYSSIIVSINEVETYFVRGNAPDKNTILNYTKALRDTGRFANVTVSNMQEIDYSRWSFFLSLE